jgi:hypothetical protein
MCILKSIFLGDKRGEHVFICLFSTRYNKLSNEKRDGKNYMVPKPELVRIIYFKWSKPNNFGLDMENC